MTRSHKTSIDLRGVHARGHADVPLTFEDWLEQSLIGAVEGEIIPQLLRAHRAAVARQEGRRVQLAGSVKPSESLHRPSSFKSPIFSESEVLAFADLLVGFEGDVAKRFVDAQLARGHSVSMLLMDLCAPAARELGRRWADDACSFCDVTIGLSTLENIIHHCSSLSADAAHFSSKAMQAISSHGGAPHGRTALLAPMPGNQHVFGLLIVKELFIQAGWAVRSPVEPSEDAVISLVRSGSFDLIGLSAGDTSGLQACTALIKTCRTESLNPEVRVLVGGSAVLDPSINADMLGADLIVRDGQEEMMRLDSLLVGMANLANVN